MKQNFVILRKTPLSALTARRNRSFPQRRAFRGTPFFMRAAFTRYAANGVRLPKGAAFGRAKIVCKRKKGKSVVFPFLSICFKASAILHSTFYIYNGNPSVRAGKPALTQDDRGRDSACSPTLAFPLGGRCHSERMTDEGRRYIRVRAAKGRARSLKNFIKTLRRPLDRAARFLYNGCIVNLG